MRFCDITFAYTASSGGIRTYLDRKRAFIRDHTKHEHVLIVPGETPEDVTEGPLRKIVLHGPTLPGCEPYRFFARPDRILNALRMTRPDCIELGSFFTSPWAAFRYRGQCLATEGRHCRVGGYFHTDLAEAYFAAPVRQALTRHLAASSETLHDWLDKAVDAVSSSAELLFGKVFEHCDLVFAASQVQADRLHDYGIDTVHVVPLGVDLEQFHPRHRSQRLHQRIGADRQDRILLYAGRIDVEKDPGTLVEAFARLDLPGRTHLVLMGEGPEKEDLQKRAETLPGLHLLPFEGDKDAVAETLASADIYVTAGPHETFGLSVIEAQASGLPVVGVNAGALTERVPETVGLLAEPGNPDSFARCIEAIARDRDAYAEAARRFVVEQGCDWESTFRQLLAYYTEGADSLATTSPSS